MRPTCWALPRSRRPHSTNFVVGPIAHDAVSWRALRQNAPDKIRAPASPPGRRPCGKVKVMGRRLLKRVDVMKLARHAAGLAVALKTGLRPHHIIAALVGLPTRRLFGVSATT